MDAPSRYPGPNAGPKAFRFHNVSENEAKQGINSDRRERVDSQVHMLHPNRTCVECVKQKEDLYKYTSEWRHVKDEKGKIIEKDANGHEVWLCNTHGLRQDRAINKAKAKGAEILETKKRMSVDSMMNPAITEEEAIHVRKKMSVDSLLSQQKDTQQKDKDKT